MAAARAARAGARAARAARAAATETGPATAMAMTTVTTVAETMAAETRATVGKTGTTVGKTGTTVGKMATIDSGAATRPGSLLRDASRRVVGRMPWASWSLKTKLVAGFAALLLVAGAGAFLAARQLLLLGVDAAIEAELTQESDELRSFSNDTDPVTGRAFGNRVERMFDVYLARNTPDDHEAWITFVNGRSSTRLGSSLPEGLAVSAELPRGMAEMDQPARGSVTTPAGALEYLAVPVRSTGITLGVFVVAISRDLAAVEADRALSLAALMLGILSSVAVWLAWRIVTRTLDPVQAVTRAALRTSTSDLTQRIDVGPQGGEIAELGQAFNRVLHQRAEAFAAQERFTHDAVNRLQQPIAAMRQHIQLLQAHPRKEAPRISLVTEELERVRVRFDELVLLARSVRPDFLHLCTVDLLQVMRGTRSKVEHVAAREWRIESVGPERIVADPERLGQALLQVAHRAITHTRDGDAITIGSVVLPAEARLWVRHKDRGARPGSDERFPGHPLSPPGAEDGARTGLAIPDAIAKAHRGHLAIAGNPGGDVTVTIVVPVDQPEAWKRQSNGHGLTGESPSTSPAATEKAPMAHATDRVM
jgi:two-component system OmpR family sensor kinase